MKFLKLLMVVLVVGGTLFLGACAKESNRLTITKRAAAALKAGEVDPKVKAKMAELYSEAALVQFKLEIENKFTKFIEIKKEARRFFNLLINPKNERAVSGARRRAAEAKTGGKGPAKPVTPETAEAEKAKLANQAKQESNLWQGVKVIELLVDRDKDTKVAKNMELVLNLGGEEGEVVLTGKIYSKVTAKLTSAIKIEALALCISEECNQVLSLIKLDENNYKVVLSRAVDAAPDEASPVKVTEARVDIHAIVNSEQQEMMIYYNKNNEKVKLNGEIKVHNPEEEGTYGFVNKKAREKVPVEVYREAKLTQIIINPENKSSRIILNLSQKNANIPAKPQDGK